MKLLRDLLVVGLVAYGAFWWTHRPAPTRASALSGARPNLAMPPSPALVPQVASSMLVARESSPRMKGPWRERQYGDKPKLLGDGAADITGGRVSQPLPEELTPWADRLSQPWAMAAVVALFIVLYALLTRALRKGPGGHGFTHD